MDDQAHERDHHASDDEQRKLAPVESDADAAPSTEPNASVEPSESTPHPLTIRDPLLEPSHSRKRPKRSKQTSALANRSGEPRVFAFFWAMYLLIAAGLTVYSVREFGAFDSSTFRPAVRTLFVMIAIGVCALWPMCRLSQAAPRAPGRAAIADALVVVVPMQGVVWPMAWLGSWPWEVGLGIAVMFTSWTALVAACIAWGSASSSAWTRLTTMACILAITTGAPTIMALGATLGRQPPDATLLASPFTAVFALTAAPSGLSPRMSPGEWIAALTPMLAALTLGAFIAVRSSRSAPRENPSQPSPV